MLGTDLRFRVNFSVYNKTLTFTDLLQSYLSTGGGMKGLLSFTNPDGNIFYQTTGYGADDFSSPDTNNTTNVWVKVLSGVNFPIDTATGFVKLGNYTFNYKVSVDGGSTFVVGTKTFNLDYIRSIPEISLIADTNTSVLNVVDNTDYNVLHNSVSIIPSLTYLQTLVSPIDPTTGLPVVANVTSTQKTFTVGPNIYSRVYTNTIDTQAVYSMELWDSAVWAIVTDTILGSAILDVRDDTCMCAYYNCIASLQLQMDAVNGYDPIEYNKLRKAKDLINDYMGMYIWAVKCGQDSAYWCDKIKVILQIVVPCDCAQDDNAPHEIIPIFGGGGGGGGGGGSVTPSTFVYTFGTGAAGLPVSPHSGDVHQFTTTGGAYTVGDVWQYNGTAWVFELNVIGPAGANGSNGSNNSSANILYNLVTDTATTAGTGEQTLGSYAVPGNTLVNNGDYLETIATYTLASNDNGKTMRLYFGGNLIHSFFTDALITSADNTVILRSRITKVTTNTQKIESWIEGDYASYKTDTLDLSTILTASATGQNAVASAADITLNEFTVLLFSKLTTLPTSLSNYDKGSVNLVANVVTVIPFSITMPSTSYIIKVNAWDSAGDEQLVQVNQSLKTVTGFSAMTVVNSTLNWEVSL